MGPRAAPSFQAQATLQEEVQLPSRQLTLRRPRRHTHTEWHSPTGPQLVMVATDTWNMEQFCRSILHVPHIIYHTHSKRDRLNA